jgi:hypothetical protein
VSANLRVKVAVLCARYDDGAVSSAVYAVIKQIETEISWREHFKPIGEAASKVVNRVRRVVAPSLQAALRQPGVTTTLSEDDNAKSKED